MYFEVTRHTPMRRLVLAAMLPLTALAVFSCSSIQEPVSVPTLANVTMTVRPVRVLLGVATRAEPLMVSARSDVTVLDGDGKTVRDKVSLRKTPVGFTKKAVSLGGVDWGAPAIILVPSPGDHIQVDDTVYAGEIVLVKRGESVAVVNRVSIEDYVAGVVTCEMPSRFERAALEAQAVAARTYVLWQMKQRRLLLYDVTDDTGSQVYGGITGTTGSGKLATERTSGTVLMYNWQFLPAFYFSTCGGRTVNASYLRGAPLIEPLTGVECGYCKASKRYRWAITIPGEEIEGALGQAGYITGKLLDLSVVKAIDGGWVDTVEIKSSEGVKQISGYALRQVVGTSRLYSTNFEIEKSGDKYILRGRGYGHGVGLCQWGANGMADLGHNYVDILKHYYQGAGVLKIY